MTKYIPVKENGISFGMISVILLSMLIVLILAMIKIYFSNQIYAKSKSVNSLIREVSVLKSENDMLKCSVEEVKFKNRVEDTLFYIEDN